MSSRDQKVKWSWSSAIIGAATSTAIASLLRAKPKDPTFHLISIDLTSLKLNLPVLDAELMLTVHVTNPNIAHLERVANMEEPNDPKSKAHYLDALVLYSNAIFNQGRREEAAKYLRRVVAYDPSFNELLKQCEEDDTNFTSSSESSTHKN